VVSSSQGRMRGRGIRRAIANPTLLCKGPSRESRIREMLGIEDETSHQALAPRCLPASLPASEATSHKAAATGKPP